MAALAAAVVLVFSIMPVIFGDGGWERAAIIGINIACISAAGAANLLSAEGRPEPSLAAACVPILFVVTMAILLV